MKLKKKFKIILFLLLTFFNQLIIYKFSNLKIAICTMAKKENEYIKEYVDYYIKLGVDHIFIYDNNDEYSEKISDIIDKSYKN